MTGKTSQKDPANSSNTGGSKGGSDQSSTRPGSTNDGGAGDGGKSEDRGGAAGRPGDGGGKGGSGTGQAQGGNDAGSGPKAIDSTPASGDDGGSSPLVPILIALAVLAAISIGVVMMRRKRSDSDPGSPVSSEAS